MKRPDEHERTLVLPVPEQAQKAMVALQKGDTASAREMLRQVVDQEPYDERFWLWLSWATTDEQEQQECIERIRMINPEHPSLKRIASQTEHAENTWYSSWIGKSRPKQETHPPQETNNVGRQPHTAAIEPSEEREAEQPAPQTNSVNTPPLPPQEEKPAPAAEQPPQEEKPEPAAEQPPQAEQPAPAAEQPPQEEQPAPAAEQPPQEEKPAPAAEQPPQEEKPEPPAEQPPQAEQPVQEEPHISLEKAAPAAEQPAAEQPPQEEKPAPAAEQPAAEQPPQEEKPAPAAEQPPQEEQPAQEEPHISLEKAAPAVEQPAPAAEQPAAEQPPQEEKPTPAAEQPAAEQPPQEEKPAPAAEQPLSLEKAAPAQRHIEHSYMPGEPLSADSLEELNYLLLHSDEQEEEERELFSLTLSIPNLYDLKEIWRGALVRIGVLLLMLLAAAAFTWMLIQNPITGSNEAFQEQPWVEAQGIRWTLISTEDRGEMLPATETFSATTASEGSYLYVRIQTVCLEEDPCEYEDPLVAGEGDRRIAPVQTYDVIARISESMQCTGMYLHPDTPQVCAMVFDVPPNIPNLRLIVDDENDIALPL